MNGWLSKMDSKTRIGITGNELKLIAMITMLVDHIAFGFYQRYALANNFYNQNFYMVLRGIGRMAFPIYCFLLVEGFYHTKNVKKYAVRLLILALISEVPFDFGLYAQMCYLKKTNVVFTLLIGLLLIWTIDAGKKGYLLGINNLVLSKLVQIVVYASGCAIAYFCHTDYNMIGVAAIVIMYVLHGQDSKKRALSFAAGVLILTIGFGSLEAWAFLMLIPVYLYNGKRGSSSKIIRYGFNYFYPIHLLILGIVTAILL